MKRKSSPEIIELSDDESTSSPRSSRHKRDSEELTSFSYGFCLTGIPGIVDEHSTLLIEDIFSEDPRFPLLQCVIFTYTLDLEFIFSAAPILQRTAITIIHGESPQKTDMMEVQRLKFPNLTLLRANLPIPYGTHHSKMIILRYTNGIRIGIGTSNFEPRDWLLKTQAWWIRDFPLKKSKNGQASEFEEGLSEYLAHYRFKNINLVNLIRPFDFSSAHCVFVGSVPGYHKGDKFNKFGLQRLHHCLSKKKSRLHTNSPVIAQFSSLGSLSEKYLMDYMCRSITGVSFGSKKTASSKSLDLRIIWPSSEDVRNSLEGWAAGCSIPCPSKNMKPFLRKFLYKWSAVEVSGRGRAMPHIKCYFQPGFENSSIDWFLLTSANLSSAAWGSFQKDDSQLMIRSYEAGVLFLDSAVAQATPNFSCTPDRKVPWANTFPTTTEVLICKLCHVRTSIPIEPQIPKLSLGEIAITLPIPFEWNTSRYDNQDDPWVWDIPRAELDVHGESYLC